MKTYTVMKAPDGWVVLETTWNITVPVVSTAQGSIAKESQEHANLIARLLNKNEDENENKDNR